MHFIFGGAYNGKTAYAKQLASDAPLFTAHMPTVEEVRGQTIIIRHIEQCVTLQADERLEAMRIVEQLEQLASVATVIVIGNDISRGVVPIQKEARFQRDCAGRLYQLLVQRAKRVTQIWYGLPQTIKGV